MKIGILSDIHSNIVALKACVEHLEALSCDEFFILGDFISDTPYTRETMDFIYDFISKHTCHLLRGNREEYMLAQREALSKNSEKDKWIWNSASGNLLFAYQQLEERDFSFFESLPISFKFQKEGYPPIICCHGSPNSSRELMQVNGANTKEWLEQIDTDYMICAHTHYPGEFSHKEKHYYNPGCVGIAIGTPGMAQCMTLEDVIVNEKTEWRAAFIKVPYDNNLVVHDMRERGLLNKAPWFINSNIQILLTGIDNSAQMVQLAAELSREAGETNSWPLIEEKYFAEAASMLGIPDYRDKIEEDMYEFHDKKCDDKRLPRSHGNNESGAADAC